MKRILVMGMSKDRGGMETCIMNYYRAIDHSKFQFDFISYNELPYCADEIRTLGGRCFVITGRSASFCKNKKEFRAFFREHGSKYAAVWYNCCLISDLTLFRLAVKYGIPKRIIHAHTSEAMGNFLSNGLHRRYRRKITRYATDFWACSQEAGAFFYDEATLRSDRFRVITNAIRTDAFRFNEADRARLRQQFGLGDSLVIGNVARMEPEKNQLFALEIFRCVLKRRPDAFFLLIGQGRLESALKTRTEELGLSDHVLFLGQRHDVPALYSAMDAFLLPSRFEGLGITLIEAQTSGLPSYAGIEAVPSEAAATPLLRFLSLEDSPAQWAEAICRAEDQASPADRVGAEALMAAGEWDIRQAVLLMEELF